MLSDFADVDYPAALLNTLWKWWGVLILSSLRVLLWSSTLSSLHLFLKQHLHATSSSRVLLNNRLLQLFSLVVGRSVIDQPESYWCLHKAPWLIDNIPEYILVTCTAKMLPRTFLISQYTLYRTYLNTSKIMVIVLKRLDMLGTQDTTWECVQWGLKPF